MKKTDEPERKPTRGVKKSRPPRTATTTGAWPADTWELIAIAHDGEGRLRLKTVDQNPDFRRFLQERLGEIVSDSPDNTHQIVTTGRIARKPMPWPNLKCGIDELLARFGRDRDH